MHPYEQEVRGTYEKRVTLTPQQYGLQDAILTRDLFSGRPGGALRVTVYARNHDIIML